MPRFASLNTWGGGSEDSEDDGEDMSDEGRHHEEGALQRSGKLLVLEQILPLWHKQVQQRCMPRGRFLRKCCIFTQQNSIYLCMIELSRKATLTQLAEFQHPSEMLPTHLMIKTQGHRVLLFSQTRQMLNFLEKFVKCMRWSYGRLDGNTPVSARQVSGPFRTIKRPPDSRRVSYLGVSLRFDDFPLFPSPVLAHKYDIILYAINIEGGLARIVGLRIDSS